MYFKDFPQFLYDFNYGNGVVKTTVVKDITRNIRIKKDILANVVLFEEYDIIDGETPEIIAEKFYGSPEYHWVIMIANEMYDWTTDLPLIEDVLQKHIKTYYNPTLNSSDWFWDRHEDGRLFIHIKITGGSSSPFEVAFLTSPTKITLYDKDRNFVKVINFPVDEIGLDETTQYFYFPYDEGWDITQFGKGDSDNGVGNVTIYIDTEGRENNPVYFVDSNGMKVNPSVNAIPVTGDVVHRIENDAKRRIKIISPSLLETLVKNYEELLR